MDCKAYGALIRTNPNIKARVLQEMICANQRLEVPKSRIYIGKRFALKSIREDHKFAFMKCNTDASLEDPIFEQFCLSFAAQIEGFIANCRPYIELNGYHLRGAYRGVLLTAVALDANNMIFPLAIAVVDSKNLNN